MEVQFKAHLVFLFKIKKYLLYEKLFIVDTLKTAELFTLSSPMVEILFFYSLLNHYL